MAPAPHSPARPSTTSSTPSCTSPRVPVSPLTQTTLKPTHTNDRFELILRLKGNHLWPAQWSSAFCVDDAQNQALADLYGIVMGTSHEEPMMRSIPVEWNLFGTGPWDYSANNATIYEFWVQGAERARPFEGMWTVGMRGNGACWVFACICERLVVDACCR